MLIYFLRITVLVIISLYFIAAFLAVQNIAISSILNQLRYPLIIISLFLTIGLSVLLSRFKLSWLDIIFILIIAILLPFSVREQFLFINIIWIFVIYTLGRAASTWVSMHDLVNLIINISRLLGASVSFIMINQGGSNVDLLFGEVNQNTWALFVSVMFSVILFSYHQSSRFFDLIILGLLFVAVLIIGSRGGILCVSLIGLYYLLKNFNYKKVLVAFAISSLVLYIVNSNDFSNDFRIVQQYQMFKHGEEFDVSTGRIDGLYVGLDAIAKNILFGSGNIDLNNYSLSYTQIHNFFVRIIAEFGIVVFVGIMALFSRIIFLALGTKKEYLILVHFLLITWLLPLFYEPNGAVGNIIFSGMLWFLLGVVSRNGYKEGRHLKKNLAPG